MTRKTPPEFEVEINLLVFGGEGIGHFDGRPVFVYGVLPGEVALVRPLKVNSGFVRAQVIKIIQPSPERVLAKEDHYLTCSPWQIIGYEQQLAYKKAVVISMWNKLAKSLPQSDVSVTPSPKQWHYRNKLEFSVSETETGQPALAFHQRFRHSQFYQLESCLLGSEKINQLANLILDQAVTNGYGVANIKNILVRYSFATDKVIAALYTTNPKGKIFTITDPALAGFSIIYSNPKSPAAVITDILSEQGSLELTENIAGLNLKYGLTSFFQVNPPAFSLLMQDIKQYLSADKYCLLDLYAGVGTIGLVLADIFKNIQSIEINAEATKFAIINTKNNKLDNVHIINSSTEKQSLDKLLQTVDTVVVDPPRAGLHSKVVHSLLVAGPADLIYISCNPATQARDWNLLKDVYSTVHWQLYDLYPQTPHVESVLILKRRS